MVELLLRHGADATAKDRDGGAPLHAAACKGHAESVRLLLKYGAEVSSGRVFMMNTIWGISDPICNENCHTPAFRPDWNLHPCSDFHCKSDGTAPKLYSS